MTHTAGVEMRGSGEGASLEKCLVRGNQRGVCATDGARGALTNCEVFDNATHGVVVSTEAHPTLQGTKVRMLHGLRVCVHGLRACVSTPGVDFRLFTPSRLFRAVSQSSRQLVEIQNMAVDS